MDRHELLSALKRATIRELEVGGAKFHIRGLTGAERIELMARNKAAKEEGGKPFTDSELCSWAICSPEGERLFKDATELGDVDGDALATIALAILDASGLTTGAQERAAGESQASPS